MSDFGEAALISNFIADGTMNRVQAATEIATAITDVTEELRDAQERYNALLELGHTVVYSMSDDQLDEALAAAPGLRALFASSGTDPIERRMIEARK